MERDYNQHEIDSMITELLTIHCAKLKESEIEMLQELTGSHVTFEQRDILIGMYDRMGEASY